jgi:chromosome partitioning protein
MPVIAIANSKGGSGKSTTALILAGELATGADVVLIDADPRRPLAAWARAAGVPARLEVVESGGTDTILDEIEQAAARVPFVVIDLEGTASKLTSYAIGQADLVLVPCQEQHQDAQAAIATLAEVRRDAQAVRRAIPSAVVLTRTRVVAKNRTARHVAAQLRGAGPAVRVLKTEIAERDAFAAMFSAAAPLRGLDATEVNNLPAAIANAEALVAEIVAMLRHDASLDATGSALRSAKARV